MKLILLTCYTAWHLINPAFNIRTIDIEQDGDLCIKTGSGQSLLYISQTDTTTLRPNTINCFRVSKDETITIRLKSKGANRFSTCFIPSTPTSLLYTTFRLNTTTHPHTVIVESHNEVKLQVSHDAKIWETIVTIPPNTLYQEPIYYGSNTNTNTTTELNPKYVYYRLHYNNQYSNVLRTKIIYDTTDLPYMMYGNQKIYINGNRKIIRLNKN